MEINSFNIPIEIEISEKPEGLFYVATADVGNNETIVGMARTKALAVAICFDNIANKVRNKHYEKKRAEMAKQD